MTNEEKAIELAYRGLLCSGTWDCLGSAEEDEDICMKCNRYYHVMEMAQWKDEQPLAEQGGWHTEEPTEDGWYLVDTPDFPKNCYCVVAEWDNDAKRFYSEASDFPIEFCKWKLIEKR